VSPTALVGVETTIRHRHVSSKRQSCRVYPVKAPRSRRSATIHLVMAACPSCVVRVAEREGQRVMQPKLSLHISTSVQLFKYRVRLRSPRLGPQPPPHSRPSLRLRSGRWLALLLPAAVYHYAFPVSFPSPAFVKQPAVALKSLGTGHILTQPACSAVVEQADRLPGATLRVGGVEGSGRMGNRETSCTHKGRVSHKVVRDRQEDAGPRGLTHVDQWTGMRSEA
jgi:hypothetical protein